MKILYDLSSTQKQGSMSINGGGDYALALCSEVLKCKNENDSIIVLLNNNLTNTESINAFIEENKLRCVYYNEIKEIETIVNTEKCNKVIFPVCYSKYGILRFNKNIRVIVTIHDLNELYNPEIHVKYGKIIKGDGLDWLRLLKRKILFNHNVKQSIKLNNSIFKMSDNMALVTVSHYTKSAFEYYLNIPKSININVCYPMDTKALWAADKNVLSKYGLREKKYFLLSSGCRISKNNAIAIFTLDRMFSKNKYSDILQDFKAIVLGTDEKYKKYYLSNIKNKDRFIFDGYVTNTDMNGLYKYAHLFVYPSILEGFGSPPVEAMRYGTVSAVSTAMSIPEVCGDSAIYFDPYSENSIEQAILQSFDYDYMRIKRENAIRRFGEISNLRIEGLKRVLDVIKE